MGYRLTSPPTAAHRAASGMLTMDPGRPRLRSSCSSWSWPLPPLVAFAALATWPDWIDRLGPGTVLLIVARLAGAAGPWSVGILAWPRRSRCRRAGAAAIAVGDSAGRGRRSAASARGIERAGRRAGRAQPPDRRPRGARAGRAHRRSDAQAVARSTVRRRSSVTPRSHLDAGRPPLPGRRRCSRGHLRPPRTSRWPTHRGLHGWAATVEPMMHDLPSRPPRALGPWGAFIVVEVAPERAGAVLMAPWEGRGAVPGGARALSLLGQNTRDRRRARPPVRTAPVTDGGAEPHGRRPDRLPARRDP